MMWTVKIGGSLADSPNLTEWVTAIDGWRTDGIVLVPGGGPFADRVREMQKACGYDDAAGHDMAVLAMEQYGLMLAARCPSFTPCSTEDEIHRAVTERKIALWRPSRLIRAAADIPKIWDYTSDSLAGWLARRLNSAGLLLIKSRDPGAPCPVPLSALQKSGLIDPAFSDCLRGVKFPVRCAGPSALNVLGPGPKNWRRDGPGVQVDIHR